MLESLDQNSIVILIIENDSITNELYLNLLKDLTPKFTPLKATFILLVGTYTS